MTTGFKFNPFTGNFDIVTTSISIPADTTSTFTDGSVIFAASSNLAEDNANLFWDNASNKLGIGTNTPESTLHVNGDVLIANDMALKWENSVGLNRRVLVLDSANTLTMGSIDVQDVQFFHGPSRSFNFFDGNQVNVAFLIDNVGNIGIRNNGGAPGSLLDIGLAGTTLGTMRLAGDTSGNVTIQPASAAGTWSLTLPTTGGTNKYALTTDGSGVSTWSQIDLTAAVTGVLPIANGGTGSATLNVVQLTGNQIIAGTKTFSSTIAGDISGNAATVTTNANLTGDVTSVGNATTYSAIVPETKGGTNQSTYTTGDLLYASGSNTLSKRSIGSSGDVLTVTGGVPTWAPNSPSTPANSTIYLDTASGHGSVGTAIRTFNTANTTGTDLTYTSDSTNGDKITVNTTGRYGIMWVDRNSGGAQDIGITVNQSNLTQASTAVSAAELVFWTRIAAAGGSINAQAYFTAADVIRFNDGGTCNNTISSSKQAIVTRLS